MPDIWGTGETAWGSEAFAGGSIAFNWSHMGHINGPGEIIYNSNHDYGIVPMPMGPNATEYYFMSSTNDALIIQATHNDLRDLVAIMNEWALVVNDKQNYLDVLDDGRCRTEADKEMMINYILPSYKLNRRHGRGNPGFGVRGDHLLRKL